MAEDIRYLTDEQIADLQLDEIDDIIKYYDSYVSLGRGRSKSQFLSVRNKILKRKNEILEMLEKMDIRQRIGQQIADLRTQEKLTQQQLADAAGITRVHLSRIESGRYSVGIDILEKVAAVLHSHIELIQD